ncbi:MAG: phosphoenolpyruvate--protein phosphotransferase [Calditrichaeota bacterium]|nr:phosphoenolpyruvate--protein phosphotransferase [Calditrichota bacterium]MCB9391829.1 phosphoenolpyruvate--protein phosphotransferase [Calditrichota bacterium]
MGSESGKECILRGIPAAHGIAIGRVHLITYNEPEVLPRKLAPAEVPEELARFNAAVEQTKGAIERSRERALDIAGIAVGKIFDAHLLILGDTVFQDQVRGRIAREQFDAEYIIYDSFAQMIELISRSAGEVFRERAADLRDVRARLLRHLRGEGDLIPDHPTHEVVLVAEDLSPTQALNLDRKLVHGIATDIGGLTSHTAILARSLDIPTVVGIGDISARVHNGDAIILNGNSGKVIVHPQKATLAEYESKRERFRGFQRMLEDIRTQPAMTTDGREILLWGNIELPREAELVMSHGGTGVGLFRSEFLFLTRETTPTEDEQFGIYDKAAELMAPYPVVIRTFDLGGDKYHAGINIRDEKNPFLGYRALRVSLSRRDLFRSQLRAILRASARENVMVMFPFVSGLEELREAKVVLEEAKQELQHRKLAFDPDIRVGIMVEIPSAAVFADRLAEECDFLSIGTNDLIQYTVAADRANEQVAGYYRSFHPAVLRMIEMTVKAGEKRNVHVGLCGELGGTPAAVPLLVGLGMTELSMTSSMIPEIKKIIRSLSYEECKRMTRKAMKMGTSHEIQQYMQGELKKRFADLPIWF